MGDKLICSEPPGICCQEDFDHDWKIVMGRLDPDTRFDIECLLYMAKEKGYSLWLSFMETSATV